MLKKMKFIALVILALSLLSRLTAHAQSTTGNDHGNRDGPEQGRCDRCQRNPHESPHRSGQDHDYQPCRSVRSRLHPSLGTTRCWSRPRDSRPSSATSSEIAADQGVAGRLHDACPNRPINR